MIAPRLDVRSFALAALLPLALLTFSLSGWFALSREIAADRARPAPTVATWPQTARLVYDTSLSTPAIVYYWSSSSVILSDTVSR